MTKKTHREEAVDWLTLNDRWLAHLPEELDGLQKCAVQHYTIIKELRIILGEFVERICKLEKELAEHRHTLPEEHTYIYPPDLNFLIDSREAFYQSLFARLKDVTSA
jgi:hypothetical protein